MEDRVADHHVSDQLNKHFSNNIKFSFFPNFSITIIVTNDDKVYIFDRDCSVKLRLENEFMNRDEVSNKFIESKIVNELCGVKVTDFAKGLDFVIALTEDQKVYCWGKNTFGQLGNGTIMDEDKPKLNTFLSDKRCVKVRCGYRHSFALTEIGDVYAWGCNAWGETGCNSYNLFISKPIDLMANNSFDGEKIEEISCGYGHSIALTKNKRVFGWGYNEFGQLGTGDLEKLYSLKPIVIMEKNSEILFKKISCGRYHSLLLSEKGDIYAFGYNEFGQLGIGSDEMIHETPVKIVIPVKFNDITSYFNGNFSMAKSSDHVYVWGYFGLDKILIPKETKFKTFNEMYITKFGMPYGKIDGSLNFNDFFIKNGIFKNLYKETKQIGEGSYGKVFSAIVAHSNRRVAVKEIPIKSENEHDFLKEYLISHRIANFYCDSLVKYNRIWFENNYIETGSKNVNNLSLYIEMNLCDITLEEMIEHFNKDPVYRLGDKLSEIGYYIASELFIKILEGVKYLNSLDIIHRDLKPNNILIQRYSSDSFIKITDFGLATIHDFNDKTHKSDQGDRNYMAPEVLDGTEYTTKADIYSLGVIMKSLFNIYINSSIDDKESKSSFFLENCGDSKDKCLEMEAQLNVENSKETSYLLKHKYQKLKETCLKMTQDSDSDRPDCDAVLKDKSWALDYDELDIETELNLISNYKSDQSCEQSLLHSILQSKFCFNGPKIENNKHKENYKRDKDIGSGSFGNVFMANHRTRNDIAIKKVQISFKKDYVMLKNFIMLSSNDELHTIRCGYLVQYFDSWFEENQTENSSKTANNKTYTFYAEMELCDKNLKDIIREIKEDPIFENEILTLTGYYIASELFNEILEGVNYLHEREPPVIHCDLKPSNILLKRTINNTFIKISDIGLMSIHDRNNNPEDEQYIAPEVIDNRKYDIKADIYSLGVIMKELFDIEKFVDHENESCILTTKYQNAKVICERMTEQLPYERFNAKPENNLTWALSIKELNDYEKHNGISYPEQFSRSFINPDQERQNSYLHYILQSKLGFENSENIN